MKIGDTIKAGTNPCIICGKPHMKELSALVPSPEPDDHKYDPLSDRAWAHIQTKKLEQLKDLNHDRQPIFLILKRRNNPRED